MKYKAIKISPRDNVAIATTAIPKDATVAIQGNDVVVTKQDIPLGHKIALVSITNGDAIIRYGEAICSASEDIAAGDWVHGHNTISRI